jgi:membrane dipeptidase
MAPLVADGHSDALLPLMGRSLSRDEVLPRDFFAPPAREGEARSGHMDLARLLAGGVSLQALALFIDDPYLALGPRAESFLMLELFERVCEDSKGALFPFRGEADARLAHEEGRVAALLSIEGGEALEGSLASLGVFAAKGLRLFGLTWNRRNELGRGVRAPGSGGLTVFGRAVVRECERLGIVVDASHLSDEAFDDLAAWAERPFVASHSNCRALCSNARNLDDARIERLAASGGLIGLTFVPFFVTETGGAASLEALLAQVDHAVAVAGIEAVGFGSDFDGYEGSAGDFMRGPASWPLLEGALLEHGYTPAEVAALLGENWLRVLGGPGG